MNNETVFGWIGVGLYTLTLMGVFIYTQAKRTTHDRSIRYEALGSARFGSLAIAVTVAATMLGPADTVSLSQNGLSYGLVWVVFPLGAALAQVVSGKFLIARVKDQHTDAVSIGDIFAVRCGRGARIFAGTVIFVQSVAFSAALVLAGGQIMESFLGLPLIYGLIYTSVIVGIYSSFGGITTVIRTDNFQIIFVVVIIALCLAASVTILLAQSGIDGQRVVVRSQFGEDHEWKMALALFSGYFLGELLLPFYSQRALVSESGQAAGRGFVIAGAFVACWYCVMTLSGSLSEWIPVRTGTDKGVILDVIRFMFVKESFWWFAVGSVIFAGLLALVHSTFDSILNAGAVAFSRDIVGGTFELGDEMQGWLARQTVISIAVMGLVVALSGESLISLLLIGYTIWVPTLLVPFAWMLLNPGKTIAPVNFALAVASGLVGFLLFEYLFDTFMPGILAGFLFNLASLLLLIRRQKADPSLKARA